MPNILEIAFPATRQAIRPTRRVTTGWLLGLLTIACVPVSSWPSHAQSYPERPIKIVVPFPAGGPTDIAARLIGQSLSSSLGQNVVIENLGGAGGRIGAKAVAAAN